MRKFTAIFFVFVLVIAFSGCSFMSIERPVFSENILFSLNHGAPGFGTQAECTDAEIVIHTNCSVKVMMVSADYSEIIEVGSVVLSENDYERLVSIADRDRIFGLRVKDGEADDGSSYHITLYDENDEKLVSKGGYMPVGDEFWEIYNSIKDILKPYGITEIVKHHRKILNEAWG